MTISFPEMELELLKIWKDEKFFEKSLEQTKGKPPFIFYDGPPFATGLPHHGHLVASTIKDVIPRYKTMQGHYVERTWGWDCHGLPIEHEINKKLNLTADKAVEKLGVKGYNDECRSIVQRFTSEWKQTIERLGRWVDFDNGYKTMDPSFMESVWWVFKQLWDKGLVYQGTKVMPFSTALGTPLSNFEANSNYQKTTDPAVTVLFKIKDDLPKTQEYFGNTYFAAWTTTPWTLPANLGLCVNPELDYVMVQDRETGDSIILAENCLQRYQRVKKLFAVGRHPIVKERWTGKELVGTKYQPLFKFPDLQKDALLNERAFMIQGDAFVTSAQGTGIVHLAPSFGEDDRRVMQEVSGPVEMCHLTDNGLFVPETLHLKGMSFRDSNSLIITTLRQKGQIWLSEQISHEYPFCPRSDTPLIYKAVPCWYISVEQIKDKLLAANETTTWVPSHIKNGRFGAWLEGAKDWCVSRNRVWGTPMPIWKNEVSGKTLCFGSLKEFELQTGITLSGDLHRENVDKISFTLDNEEGNYSRIPEVFDCWFESGSMPYAQIAYPASGKDLDSNFPADFIAEGLDQTRGWFYTLTVLAAALQDTSAFKNVIVNGIVLAANGKKMAKRLKNYTDPGLLMEKHGADAFRLYLLNSGLVRGEQLKFKDSGILDMTKAVLLPWYNAYKFFDTYASVDGWTAEFSAEVGDNQLDLWLLNETNSLVKQITDEMESYQLSNVTNVIFKFIDNITNWYIRLNRRRFWAEGLSEDKKQGYTVFYSSLTTLSKVVAPFAPFLSDFLHNKLAKYDKNTDVTSVHLCSYPKPNNKIDQAYTYAVNIMQQVILLGRKQREANSIKTKIPLNYICIIHPDKNLSSTLLLLEPYIKTELNVKKIIYTHREEDYIEMQAKPNYARLGERFGEEIHRVANDLLYLNFKDLQRLRQYGSITLGNDVFTLEDLILTKIPKNDFILCNESVSIKLDLLVTPKLLAEGQAREIVSKIQKLRKTKGFEVTDRIHLLYRAAPVFKKSVLEAFREYICSETLALSITNIDNLIADHYIIDDWTIFLDIRKED